MHPHRRRKKRPNYGTRTVEVSRGNNGFGFTISGQQPCILSCIVSDSPAEVAGLRAGDFLISVNGTNVSKLPHDAVVNLIGNSEGVIKMSIAENYFSDSSDEELLNGRSVQNNKPRPKYPHGNKSRMQRSKVSNFNSNGAKSTNVDQDTNKDGSAVKQLTGINSTAHCIIINPSVKNNNDITNVSAMVNPGTDQTRAIKVIRDLKTGVMFEEFVVPSVDTETPSSFKTDCPKPEPIQSTSAETLKSETISKIMDKESSVECRAVVGYLGTIEMPKQIATSSKLQTVRSCIRKMRQEKRTPCTVLMTILPSCMLLRNSSGEVLAEYPAKRINYVSCSSENDYRFFGLVTSASYPVDANDYDTQQNSSGMKKEYDIAISNSCHVFMIDAQIIEHKNHIKKAELFKISCTIDPVSGVCLEFPNNSEYIVNIIRIMYSLKSPNGFTMKGNLENISRLSNLGRKSCSPRGSNFVRKVNRPKFFHESRMRYRPDNHYPYKDNQENGVRNVHRQEMEARMLNGNAFVANSPQPSNHSEITTTSSNSDSGIGFHNDCQNISDRILVVDFPNPVHNNFNINAPRVYPAFQRDVKPVGLRDNPGRPLGVAGLNPDMDGQFLSNTTPVVEGFSGLGRPLNPGDPILLGNLPSQPSLQNMFLAKSNESEPSHAEKRDMFYGESSRPHKMMQNAYPLTDSQKQSVLNKLAVRAMPNKFEPQAQNKSPKKVNVHDHSLFHHRRLENSPQYDPVYSEDLVYNEEHHYEIIHPEENNMCNENTVNNKKVNKTIVFYNNEFRHKYTTESVYTEKAVDVPECDADYYMVDADHLNNSSIATCSYDDMSVTSSKSQDVKKANFSIDDISLYSSKSHDEVGANSSKLKQKVHKFQTSMDDILIFGKHSKSKNSPKSNQKVKENSKENNVFLHPGNVVKLRGRKTKKSTMFSKSKTNSYVPNNADESQKTPDNKDTLMKYKLSPKVFGLSRPSASVEDICNSSSKRQQIKEISWGHLEGTASEPDLRNCRSDFKGSGGSPFGRWAGGSGRALTQRSHTVRRPGNLANSEHDMYTKQQQCDGDNNGLDDDSAENGPASWALSFERLLSDPCGVHALSAFLEREFSAENIHFWTACERYAHATPQQRPSIASELHARHLAEGAPEPVNVDSHARQLTLERLSAAPPDLFLQVQKQILNLMKFDSYPRFIKSDIHKECLLAKLQGRDPPYPGDPALTLGGKQHISSPKGTNLKKSLSNAEDRRRKSLLPWHIKLRSKSRDRWYDGENGEDKSIGKGSEGAGDGDKSENNSEKDPHGSNSSLLTGWDVTKALNTKNCSSSSCACDDHKSCQNSKQASALCRVRLPYAAASSSVVPVGGSNESVRDLIDKLLRKRALAYLAYEVYLPNSNKAIDVNQSSSILAGEEVTVEQRVIFKLDLPNRKVISVKSKPNKALGDVLRPILHKYGVVTSGGICVTLGTNILELTQPVQIADGQRLHVALCSVDQNELSKAIQMKNPQENNNTVTNNNNNNNNNMPSLDEITNRVFEELLQGKADKHATNIEEDSVKSDNCSSEHSSGIFGRFLRRDDHRNKGVKIKKSNPPNVHSPPSVARSNAHSVSSEGGSSCCMEDGGACNPTQKPLIAKLRAGVRIQNAVGVPTELENTEFLENLKQIQRARLKDKTVNGHDNAAVNGLENRTGKENHLENKLSQYVTYDVRTNQNFVNGIPVAAQRIISQAAQQIIKPSPAPRLSLGQGSPGKKHDLRNVKELDRSSGDFSPSKSCFNSLENTVIEKIPSNCLISSSKIVDKDIKSSNKYQVGFQNDYLNGNEGFNRNCDVLNSSFHSSGSSCDSEQIKNGVTDPPPLPPKPKILPIKPSNWGQNLAQTDDVRMQEVNLPDVSVKEVLERNKRTVYLDQASSSFV